MGGTEAVIDLGAIRRNVEVLKSGTSAEVMAVVKADAYGHGLLECADAALRGGASWLGTAKIAEALALRTAGVDARTFAWLWTPHDVDAVAEAVAADIDLSVSSLWQLDAVREGVEASRHPARIHLKIDTGLNRNGANAADWSDLVAAAAKAQASGEVEVVGVWTHFAFADEPGNPVIAKQIEAYHEAVAVAVRAGVEPQLKHIANSAATLTLPDAHLDLVRPGVAVYGLSPVPSAGDFGLVPAMTVQTPLALAKRVKSGEGVSYGHQYTTTRDTTLALVPLGYADGVPRAATNVGPVWINGERFTVCGRVCMDQFVVDVGDHEVAAGDRVVLFGSGRNGVPTAQDWADALGTIHYEIVTRIGPRVQRVYVGG
jgi:alanine racemase